MFNHSSNDFHVKKGNRIAQLICERIFHPAIVVNNVTVNSVTPMEMENEQTMRGNKGFGSTGVK